MTPSSKDFNCPTTLFAVLFFRGPLRVIDEDVGVSEPFIPTQSDRIQKDGITLQ